MFAHVLLQVVPTAGGFVAAGAALPAAEGLIAGPGAGGGAGFAIDVEYAGLHIVQEPVSLVRIFAVQAGGQAEREQIAATATLSSATLISLTH